MCPPAQARQLLHRLHTPEYIGHMVADHRIHSPPQGCVKPLQRLLRPEQRGIRHFKYLLNTHSHDDHIDGLYYLMLNGFTADEYLHPYTEWWARADKELHGRTIKLTEKLRIPNRQVGEGDTLTLGGAELKLHRYTKVNNTNAKSLLTKVTFGSATALLCADITGRPEGIPDPACPGRPEGGRDQDSPSRHHAGGARFPDRRQPGVRYRDQLRG